MASSPELDFKTAVSLLDEVTTEVEPLKQTIAQHIASLDQMAEGESNLLSAFAQGFKGKLEIARESNAILHKCDQAIALSTKAKSSNPEMRLVLQREGQDVEITPDMVLAHSHLSKGVVKYISGNFNDALAFFKQSIKIYPTPDARLRLAYTILGLGDRDTAIVAFQRVIDKNPDADEAVEAKKAILGLEPIKLKQWKVALILSIVLGFYGIDRFYLGYIKDGFIKLFTLGGFLIWWIIDIVRIAQNNLKDANGFKLQKTTNHATITRR